MRKWLLALVALVLCGVAVFVGVRMLAPPPADLDVSRSGTTASGVYAVAIEPEIDPVERGALHAWIVTVTLPTGTPVTDAAIAVGGGMPLHGHGLPTAPQATAHIGEGRYRIEGVRFNMGGWWELSFAIASPAGEDTITFNIVL